MCHKSQKVFGAIFIGIPQHQKMYLIYVPSIWKIFSSHDVVFDKMFYSALEYPSYLYPEALVTRSVVLYIPYATSYHEKLETL